MKDLYKLLFYIRNKNLTTTKLLDATKINASNFFKQIDGSLHPTELQQMKARVLLRILKEQYDDAI